MAKIATKYCSLPLHIIRALFYLILTFVLTSLFCGNLFALTDDYKAPLEALLASEPEQMASALGDENSAHPLLRLICRPMALSQ